MLYHCSTIKGRLHSATHSRTRYLCIYMVTCEPHPLNGTFIDIVQWKTVVWWSAWIIRILFSFYTRLTHISLHSSTYGSFCNSPFTYTIVLQKRAHPERVPAPIFGPVFCMGQSLLEWASTLERALRGLMEHLRRVSRSTTSSTMHIWGKKLHIHFTEGWLCLKGLS